MNRRSIITMLIGAIAGVSGFALVALLRQRRCTGVGGAWDHATRGCRLADGTIVDVASMGDVVAGVLVALASGFILFRMFLFATGKIARPIEQ